MQRTLLVLTLALGGCFGSASELSAVGDDNPTDPAPGQSPGSCFRNEDCVLTAPTCCECPTMATSLSDPKLEACASVDCDTDLSVCATNVEAACDLAQGGQCILACAPLGCLACPDGSPGYFEEANGCLSCTCATPPAAAPACVSDGDCSRVRADCCGCAQGGEDTAVATADAASFDSALGCTSNSQCPGQANATEATCEPDFLPRCVAGSCELLDAAMPVDACGRSDLPACTGGKVCTINVDPAASSYGLGICLPPS